jgi:glycosyltransferase involved in cell wall biosynthesis
LPHPEQVSDEIGVLSLYEGFFSGGARILHTDVLAGLHGRGQRHRVISIHGQVYREATFQWMQDDPCYRKLVAAGVEVSALRDGDEGPALFDERELAAVRAGARAADVVVTLKEQPLRLVNQAGLHGPVITCLHRSDPENQGPALEQLREAVAAGRIASLVCCAESTRDAYRAVGIPAGLLEVIPNGVNLRRFRPDRYARGRMRAQLGVPDDAPLVAFAARYDTMKNVPLFLAAASRFLARDPRAHVVMCGAGMALDNAGLVADLAEAGLDDDPRVHLLGIFAGPQTLFAAADVVALTSSFGEAAPLCLIEGMMCGAVPVTTDVGDSAAIVAGRGLVVAAEPDAVAAGWAEAVARRAEFAPVLLAARDRFGRRRMIATYESLIRRTGGFTARRRPAPRPAALPAAALLEPAV